MTTAEMRATLAGLSVYERMELDRLLFPGKIPRPTTDDELHAWVRIYLNIDIPRLACCDGHVAPFEAFSHAYFARDPISVWLASRGFGAKSFMLATLTQTEAITLAATSSILGGSYEQSDRVYSYISGHDPNARGKFWGAPNAPRGMLRGDPTKRETELTNSARINVLTASHKSVRGGHPHRARLDECDEMDLSVFDAVLGGPMSVDGPPSQVVCSSTHHNPDGTMTEILKRARDKGWPVFEWCYRESMQPHGWLPESTVNEKRSVVTTAMWNIEYEMQKPSPQTRAIDPDAVRAAFDPALGMFEGKPSEEIVVVTPLHLRSFYHGTDWAKDQDWTVIQSMEERGGTDRLAAWARYGRIPWPQIVAKHSERVKRYGGPSAHDSTGIGSVIHDDMEVSSRGFNFSNRRLRNEMLSNYVATLEKGQIEYPRINYAMEEHLYCTTNDLYGSGHLPDTIAAAALALWAKDHGDAPYSADEWATVRV